MESYIKLGELKKRISALPRVKLAFLPTPLHELPRFSKALGGPRIFMKREDQTGLAFGGNKTRIFEFLLAKAIEEGADTIVAGAAVQSNYCRQLAAACRVLGLDVHLILRRIRGKVDDDIQGGLLLDLLTGASIYVIDATIEEQRKRTYAMAEELRKKGKKPYVVRMANDENLAPDVIAYTDCFCEVVEQCKDMGINPTHIYVCSCDSTQAGLELGKIALGSDINIVGITPANWEPRISQLLFKYINQAAEYLEVSCKVNPKTLYNAEEYVGQGYGVPTSQGIEMIKLMARTEGIFLDPVYTSKACAGLADHIQKGILTENDTVIFMHTGGTPALFAYRDELDIEELKTHLLIG